MSNGWILVGLSPLLAALIARRRPVLDPLISAVGVVAMIALTVRVITDGPVEMVGGALVVDRTGAAWATFALVMGLAVREFARRQLAGEPARQAFRLRSAVALVSGIALFWAADLVALGVTAVVTSLAAAALVASRPDGAPAAAVILRTLLPADAVLIAALVAVGVSAETRSLSALVEVDGALVHLAAVAIVVAALVRCAQLPASRWLVASLAAPTPASALLHAGLVNAGGVLLIRTNALVARSVVATLIGVALATVSIVVGAWAMRARAEVKTSLVWSTTSQMGFMCLQILVGLSAAGAAHLIAHGAYKASAFLASGSGLEHARVPHLHHRPDPARLAVAAVIAVAVTAAGVALAGYELDGHGGGAWLIPIFTALAAATVLLGPSGLGRISTGAQSRLIVGVGAATVAYLVGITWFESWLGLGAPAPDGAMALVIGATLATLAAAAALSRDPLGSDPLAPLRARLIYLTRSAPDVAMPR